MNVHPLQSKHMKSMDRNKCIVCDKSETMREGDKFYHWDEFGQFFLYVTGKRGYVAALIIQSGH